MKAASISTLKDAVKSLAQSLQVSTIFPAGLFVLLNAYYIVPLAHPDFDCTGPQTITILISLTLMFSYTLYAFNFPLIRLFEGYKLREDLFFRWSDRRERERFNSLKDQIWRLDRDFPSEDRLLPTKIGNAIAAFEEYPMIHYGMDAIALWSRLVPVLKEDEFLDDVTQEKAVFDFLLNTSAVVIVLGIELAYRALFLGNIRAAPFILVLTCIVFRVLYEGTYIAARQWGTVVRVAFDLYRHDLAQRLSLKPAASFEDEWDRWRAVSRFFLYRRPDYRSFKEFIPQSQLLQFKETVEHLESNEVEGSE